MLKRWFIVCGIGLLYTMNHASANELPLRSQLIQHCQLLLEFQAQINLRTTLTALPRISSWSSAVEVAHLAKLQRHAARRTSKLLKLFENRNSNRALKFVFSQIHSDMEMISNRLEKFVVDKLTSVIQQQTYENLNEILLALRKAEQRAKPKKQVKSWLRNPHYSIAYESLFRCVMNIHQIETEMRKRNTFLEKPLMLNIQRWAEAKP